MKRFTLVFLSVLIVLLALGLIIETQSRKKMAQEQARTAELKQRRLEEFNATRAGILTLLSEGRYQEVVSITERYIRELRDFPAASFPNISLASELVVIRDQALAALKQQQDTKRQTEILAELKSVSVKDYGRNRDLYQKLVTLFPNNEVYSQKLSFYESKYAEELEKAKRIAARKEQIESQFSSWDGAHGKLSDLIKQLMNDPKSYQHVETVYWDMQSHLVVKTTFRGKNAFGGVVVNWVKAKVDLDGNVLAIIEQGP